MVSLIARVAGRAAVFLEEVIEYKAKWRSQSAMRLFWVISTFCAAVLAADAQNPSADAWRLEIKGDGAQAREQLQKAAEAAPKNPAALRAYAEFLDRHRDPAAR